MPVIAGTRKESVINKAREVLREKEIPYTIKRTKTWFWVSSTKPGAAQTALREAGLEMNPITTMHSIWCSRCGAIRTFKKRAGDWICQKCGARLLMFKNPKKVKAMVHPEALESLARYKDDLKAGHTSAAEYWRGQAGAYFTANPLNTYAVFADWGGRKGTLIGFVKANNITQAGKVATGEFGKLRNRIIRLEKKGTNPEFLKKTAAQRRAGYALSKELGLEPAMARRTRDWRSPKVYRMLGLPVPPLSERRAMGLVNPLTKKEVEFELKHINDKIDHCRDLILRGRTKVVSGYLSNLQGRLSILFVHGPKTMESKITHYMSTINNIQLSLRGKNPLTAQEKREITNLANTQFAISRKYSDDPVRSSFWYGRSVGMGKIAKMFNPTQNPLMCPKCRETVVKVQVPSTRTGRMTTIGYCRTCDKRYKLYELAFNPKVRKWDPISEILEGDEEEDDMIGAEINPSEMTRMLKTLVTKSDLKEIKNALGTPKIGDVLRKVCRRRGLRNTLQVYSALIGLTGTKLNPLGAFICGRCGKRFHSMEALNIHLLKIHKVRNPILGTIGEAAVMGIGFGTGYKIVDWVAKKIKKNPAKPHTTAMVSKLPKCDFCTRTAHYDGRTVMGPWAYMCEPHFEMHGVGLGLGKGQILIKK